VPLFEVILLFGGLAVLALAFCLGWLALSWRKDGTGWKTVGLAVGCLSGMALLMLWSFVFFDPLADPAID
jgi:hypothetical protein